MKTLNFFKTILVISLFLISCNTENDVFPTPKPLQVSKNINDFNIKNMKKMERRYSDQNFTHFFEFYSIEYDFEDNVIDYGLGWVNNSNPYFSVNMDFDTNKIALYSYKTIDYLFLDIPVSTIHFTNNRNTAIIELNKQQLYYDTDLINFFLITKSNRNSYELY